MKANKHWIAGLALAFTLGGCLSDKNDSVGVVSVNNDGYTSVNGVQLQDNLATYPLGILTADETADLVFMREEEKLARDVYRYLGDVWNARVFDNIADSEQTHTEAVLTLLDRYSIDDPAAGNAEGVFANSVLQGLYNQLTNDGSASYINALMVGAAIEEIDIVDLQVAIARVQGNDDIVLVYENLMKGSRNHLRAFVRNLTSQGITYTPQYLNQDAYNAIINSSIETGSA